MKKYKEAEEFIKSKLQAELPKDLYYHGFHHTLDVLKSAETIAADEKISEEDLHLLRIAVLYHDAGFTRTYKNHEQVGCDMAKEYLPQFGFTPTDVERICGMIMATRIPQTPHNQLEKIIADADLDYLGTGEFNRISKTLYDEFKIYLNVNSEKEWNTIQMNFIGNHKYFTKFCQANREALKQKHLKHIIKVVEAYG